MLSYRPPSTKIIPPPPPEFAEQFAIGGWRQVERLYGARTDLILKWIDQTGAVCRKPRVETLARAAAA